MKTLATVSVIVLVLLALAVGTGSVNIHYVRFIDNQTLSNPVSVARVDGNRIILGDGRMIEVAGKSLSQEWKEELLKPGARIEVEGPDWSGDVSIWANHPVFIPNESTKFRLPLIAHDVPLNRRTLMGFGTCVAGGTPAK